MAQYQTPQFIEREPKVIGPLTFKRAAYLGFPLAIIFILWFLIAENYLMIFVLISVVLEGAGVVLAFFKVEGKSVPMLLTDAFFFVTRPKTFVWQRNNAKLDFHEREYVNTLGSQGLRKDELSRQSRVADLATKVQTRK